MARHYLTLDGALATKIIPYRPAFIDPEIFLIGIIRIAHWLNTRQCSDLEMFHYVIDNLPRWFLSGSQLETEGVVPTEIWDDKLNELLMATSFAMSAIGAELTPILTAIPDVQNFSYINRDGAGIYLEMHHD